MLGPIPPKNIRTAGQEPGHEARFVSIFTHFGKFTIKDVEDYMTNITRPEGGGIIDADVCDKDCLRIGGAFIRESLGTNLLQRVASIWLFFGILRNGSLQGGVRS